MFNTIKDLRSDKSDLVNKKRNSRLRNMSANEDEEPEDISQLEAIFRVVRSHWVIVTSVILVIALTITGYTIHSIKVARENEAEIAKLLEGNKKPVEDDSLSPEFDVNGTDKLLLKQQIELNSKFGNHPDGFVWDVDGSLLSLGDRTMSAEDVLYTYLRSLTTLDFNTAQRFTRRSKVLSTFSNYFDKTSPNLDARARFQRDVYRMVLLSMQPQGIEASSAFSDNRKVFTVTARLIDLSDKEFWRKDESKLMETLYTFSKSEQDRGKADAYLYNYVLNHYKNSKARLREVTFDITLTRSVPLNSGWLVTIDNDLDSLCRNSDGEQLVDYINSQYREYLADKYNG